jgi:surface-anchored protein
MKKLTISSFALLVLGLSPLLASTITNPGVIISAGHWDIGAVEHEGALELEIGQHVGETHTHYPLENSIIHFNFLGEKTPVTVGTTNLGSVWITPETEVEADSANMPFIGFSAEELAAPFTGPVTFTLTSFSYTGSGTGNFYLFEGADLFWNSTAGAGNYGSFSVDVGQHGHGEFAFSDPGTYSVTLTASANNGSLITSAPASFTFEVVPEPSTYALLGLGALAAAAWRFRRKA